MRVTSTNGGGQTPDLSKLDAAVREAIEKAREQHEIFERERIESWSKYQLLLKNANVSPSTQPTDPTTNPAGQNEPITRTVESETSVHRPEKGQEVSATSAREPENADPRFASVTKVQKNTSRSRKKECWWCANENGVLKCSGCLVAKYCGAACQGFHWKNGHKVECKNGIVTSMGTLDSVLASLFSDERTYEEVMGAPRPLDVSMPRLMIGLDPLPYSDNDLILLSVVDASKTERGARLLRRLGVASVVGLRIENLLSALVSKGADDAANLELLFSAWGVQCAYLRRHLLRTRVMAHMIGEANSPVAQEINLCRRWDQMIMQWRMKRIPDRISKVVVSRDWVPRWSSVVIPISTLSEELQFSGGGVSLSMMKSGLLLIGISSLCSVAFFRYGIIEHLFRIPDLKFPQGPRCVVCEDESRFVASTDKELLRFEWTGKKVELLKTYPGTVGAYAELVLLAPGIVLLDGESKVDLSSGLKSALSSVPQIYQVDGHSVYFCGKTVLECDHPHIYAFRDGRRCMVVHCDNNVFGKVHIMLLVDGELSVASCAEGFHQFEEVDCICVDEETMVVYMSVVAEWPNSRIIYIVNPIVK